MDLSQISGVRWVHVFEEDMPGRAVYRPDSLDIPLSRRPRRRLELSEDGGATLFTGGADDRFVAHRGAWRVEQDELALDFPDVNGGLHLRILEATATRLIASA